MRKPILCLALGVIACGDEDARIAVIDGFLEGATEVTCEPVDLDVDVAPTELRLATDSTWMVLDAPQLQIVTFDDRLRVLDRTAIPAMGPGAATNAVSAVALGDTAFVVAAKGGVRLVTLSRTGGEPRTAPLDFIPHSLAAESDGSVLVTPMPFGNKPPTLLARYTGRGWDTLAVPKRSYLDMTINALGNSTLVEVLPDGRALVVHQFLAPRAFRVGTSGEVESLRLPTPDATREQIEYVPRPPLTEDQVHRILVPAMAMSVDPLRSEVYVLTRSGRMAGEAQGRAVLRLTADLDFVQGYTLPVRAVSMVYLPRRGAAVAVDAEDRFHLCPLPTREGAHAPAR